MSAQETHASDERAIEVGQLSQAASSDSRQIETTGYFEPHELDKLSKNGRLYLIADEISGGAFGQIAGHYAIKKILHSFYTGAPPDDPKARLLELIQAANASIFERNSQYPARRIMATTLVAALIHKNTLFVANVGDSRVYVIWDQDIELLTRKNGEARDTLPPEKEAALDKSEPSPSTDEEAHPEEKSATLSESHPSHPSLPRALGFEKQVKIDTFSRRLFAGDVVFLCNGGLASYVKEKEIARSITRYPPVQAMPRLIALAAQRGNRNHLSISVARVLSGSVTLRPPQPMTLPLAPNWDDWEISPGAGRPSSSTRAGSDPVIESPGTPTLPKTTRTPISKPEISPEAAHRLVTSLPQIDKKRPLWRWQSWALIILVSVCFFCALPWLAWQYLIPPEMIAAIPFLGDIEWLVRDEGPTEEAVIEAEATPQNDDQAEQTAISGATGNPDGTPVAGSDPSISTPEMQPVSPISTPTSASTNTPAQSNPQPEMASPTVSVPPTLRPAPLPTIVLPSGCVNKGRFRRDVTVPDGEQMAPDESFEKIWLVQNAGDCPWGPGYTARFISGDLLGNEDNLPIIEVTNPDEIGEIRVPMIAPAVPGQYQSAWQVHDLAGEPFGPELYVEIEVVPGSPATSPESGLETLYDFVENAGQAAWSTDQTTYTLLETSISEDLVLPAPRGLVALGPAQLRGNISSEGNALLTYPHQEFGFIAGVYTVDTPLQPTDALAATLGFIKLSILSDDGVTFEVIFTPTAGPEQVILSRAIQYRDSPVTEIQPLTSITPGQTGTFTLRVLGGDSLSQDWAVWIDLRLVRPE